MTLWLHPECGMDRFYPGHQCTNYGDCPRPHEASLRDKLTDRGWVDCGTCEGKGEGSYVIEGWAGDDTAYVPCPDCVEGLIPPEGMVEFVRQETMRGDRLTFSQTTIRTHLIAAARWEREQ